MQPIHLFDLASQQARWLSLREATIASNVANANTPGYKALDVKPFAEVMQQTQLQLAATDPLHLVADTGEFPTEAIKQTGIWEVTDSGNSVSPEQEMMRAGEVSRAYALNTNIVKAFHGMVMASLKE